MKKLMTLSLTLCLVSALSACTINNHFDEPVEKDPNVTSLSETAKATKTVNAVEEAVKTQNELVTKNCLDKDMSALLDIEAVNREDYSPNKDVVGYIKALEKEHKKALVIKEKYVRGRNCKQ